MCGQWIYQKALLNWLCKYLLFSQSIVNYVSFLNIFSIDLKVWAYPTLVISWFISFSLIFLIKLFCYITKKSRQKFKYLENKKSIWREMKIIFHYFWWAFSCQELSQTCECAFKLIHIKFEKDYQTKQLLHLNL